MCSPKALVSQGKPSVGHYWPEFVVGKRHEVKWCLAAHVGRLRPYAEFATSERVVAKNNNGSGAAERDLNIGHECVRVMRRPLGCND